ncbi:MAG TPA: glycosyltransferase [Steroidobacteraceae bacterium]|jgi:glycosyltransferase involved in cell wall biosynthesis|nr:glycosyltransferase [Steroidobacteraceae bacterium]
MKALVIAPQPFFTPRGTPFSVYYRTLVLAENGVDIDLLTYGQGADVDLPRTRVVRIPSMRWLGKVSVGPSIKKAFLDIFMIAWTLGLLIRHRYQVVHAHEEAVFWCRFLKPIFRFRLIYDMHSSLPQQLTNFDYTRSRALIGLFNTLENSCLHAADAVITICPDLSDYALKVGVDPSKHLLIENCIFDDVKLRSNGDEGLVTNHDLELQLIARLSQDKRPRVVYAGTFEPYQGIEVLVKAFAGVVEVVPTAQLVLAGGTPEQIQAMRKLAVDHKVDRSIEFVGTVSKRAAVQLLKLATVLVSPRMHGTNTPLKIYELLASGIPLVATRIWSHTQVLNDEVCILVDANAEAIAQGMITALQDKVRVESIARGAQALYESRYTRSIYVQKIRQLISLVA